MSTRIAFFENSRVSAGFPSPADDFQLKRLDLTELLISQPHATFLWKVAGWSMKEAGIHDGDLVVVNRAKKPIHGCIVVAQIENDFTIKYFHSRGGRIKLVPANATFPEIHFTEGETMTVCGVVTAAIKRFD